MTYLKVVRPPFVNNTLNGQFGILFTQFVNYFGITEVSRKEEEKKQNPGSLLIMLM